MKPRYVMNLLKYYQKSKSLKTFHLTKKDNKNDHTFKWYFQELNFEISIFKRNLFEKSN